MKMPQSSAPTLVDTAARASRHRRITPEGMFLNQAAVVEVKDRLELVNRTFTAPVIVTPMQEYWAAAFPNFQVSPDSETLSLGVGEFDLVVHAMGLHWANDPVGQLIQCRRALKPDGLLLVICFGGETLTELRAVLGQAEIEVTGGLSPRVAPMAEIRELGALLQRAGLALPVADSVPLTVQYRDIWHLMRDLRSMGEANALQGRIRSTTRRAVFDRAETLYAEHFGTDGGRLPATFELICLTGWSPAETQPKPLRPGSAQARLAEALGTKESKLSN